MMKYWVLNVSCLIYHFQHIENKCFKYNMSDVFTEHFAVKLEIK